MKKRDWLEKRKSISKADSLLVLEGASRPEMVGAMHALRANNERLRTKLESSDLFSAQCRVHAVGLFLRAKGVPMTAKNAVFEMMRFAIAGEKADLRWSWSRSDLADAVLGIAMYWLVKLNENQKLLADDDPRFSIESEVDIRAHIRSCLRRIRLRAGVHPVAEAKRLALIHRKDFIEASLGAGAEPLDVLVAAVAMELPTFSEGASFIFPVNDETAEILETSRSSLGRALEEVVSHRLIKSVTPPNYKLRRARRFKLRKEFRPFSCED